MRSAIIFILDRSASMRPHREETIEAVNAYFENQREAADDALVYLVAFSSPGNVGVGQPGPITGWVLYDWCPLSEIRPITADEYWCAGMTALFDCACQTIDKAGERFAALPEDKRPDRVLCVMLTDGMENASQEFTRADLLKRIEHQRDHYSWQFVYLGANQDAISEGASFGVGSGSSANYSVDNIPRTVGILAEKSKAFRSAATPEEAKQSMTYSAEERRRMTE